MKVLLSSFFLLLTLLSEGQQQFSVDPEFADLGNRYYQRVMGIEYEPETDTYMLAGTFAGGEPFTPCLNRINHLGEENLFWNPENLDNCSGVLNNFFPTPIGYRIGANMAQLLSDGGANAMNIPDFTGTEQIAVNGPQGWADDNGAVYAGSNWRLLEEEGQPETGLLVFTPQGERYEPFPLVRVGHPNFTNIGITDIHEYDDNRLMLGGGFDSLNGHLTIRLGRIFKNGNIDTSFSSQLEPHFRAFTLHVDPQGRILVYHVEGGSEETPNDDLEIWRLLPNGDIDPSWNIIDLAMSEEDTGGGSARTTIYNEEDGSYFIYGRFNLVNGVSRSSICQVDSSGNLLATFNDFPFDLDTVNYSQFSAFTRNARILAGVKTQDGGLLLGGQFTHYQGQPFLNLIKLIPDSTVGTADRDFPVKTKIYPNPATDQIKVQLTNPKNLKITSIRIMDLSGRVVVSFPWRGHSESFNLSDLANGLYLVQVMQDGKPVGLEKLVVQR